MSRSRSVGPTARGRAFVVAAVLAATTAVPAAAHQADPRITTVVDDVLPELPDGVVLESRAGIAAQLVAANPTDTELEVVARGGEAFLRISARGVFANLESPDFYETSTPNGSSSAVPDRVRQAGGRAAPRFVRISAGTSWGWYDHRLHPTALQLPADQARAAVVGRFQVPLRFGGRSLTARGRVQFRPLLGGFQVTAAPAPGGVRVDVLQGRLPGLFLGNPSNLPLTVLGRDGEAFLRFGANGAEVNVSSRTHVEDRQARGLAAGPPSGTPRWEPVGGSTYTWLDARLRYPREAPPDAVLRRAAPSVVERWAVPVVVAGQRTSLTGEIRWVPAAAAAAPRNGDSWTGGRLTIVLGGVLALLVVATLGVRRRSRRAP